MLPNTGNLLRGGVAFGETPTRTYGLRLRERAASAGRDITYLYMLDGGTPSTFADRPLYDGGGPSTFSGLEYLYDGGGPKTLAPEDKQWRTDDWEGVLTGYVDRQEAMKQAVFLILSTERYRYPIYSWNYGVELENLYGTSMPYAMSEVRQRIAEALLQDSRITAVDNFEMEATGENLHARFVVHTIFGDIEAERTVRV